MPDDRKKESLERRMFSLGMEATPLPLEPAELDREYYNLGLEVYHRENRLDFIERAMDHMMTEALNHKRMGHADYYSQLNDEIGRLRAEALGVHSGFQDVYEGNPSIRDLMERAKLAIDSTHERIDKRLSTYRTMDALTPTPE